MCAQHLCSNVGLAKPTMGHQGHQHRKASVKQAAKARNSMDYNNQQMEAIASLPLHLVNRQLKPEESQNKIKICNPICKKFLFSKKKMTFKMMDLNKLSKVPEFSPVNNFSM